MQARATTRPPPRARAPPLVPARVEAREHDPEAQRRLVVRLRRWAGAAAGAAWTGLLAGLLLGLGRVPVPEALLWSLLAGLAAARVATTASDRAATWLLAPVEAELSLPDPSAYRAALPRRARRLGMATQRSAIDSCRLRATWAPAHAVAPLRAEWVGPGARLSGPRFAVRAAIRWAMP